MRGGGLKGSLSTVPTFSLKSSPDSSRMRAEGQEEAGIRTGVDKFFLCKGRQHLC